MHALARHDLLGPAAEIAAAAGIADRARRPEHDDGRYYNSAFFLDDRGRLRGRYRKTHLYGDPTGRCSPRATTPYRRVDFCGPAHRPAHLLRRRVPEPVRAAALAGAHLWLKSRPPR
ncbi:hypothetical protein HBB16_10435 [Pseudonocardia sp. MCCB 268]|nr:hypothetical protein [Pseudonocardia cytotoxica]